MTEADIKAPMLYVMGRNIRAEQAHHVFSITPCFHAVVSNHADQQTAQQYTQEVLKAEDDLVCRDLAAHVARSTGLPVLTISDGAEMTVVYSNGDEEQLCLSNLT